MNRILLSLLSLSCFISSVTSETLLTSINSRTVKLITPNAKAPHQVYVIACARRYLHQGSIYAGIEVKNAQCRLLTGNMMDAAVDHEGYYRRDIRGRLTISFFSHRWVSECNITIKNLTLYSLCQYIHFAARLKASFHQPIF